MATTAELESVVIHTVQTSQCVGLAANRNAGTNDESPASSSLNQTSEQESELRHRSGHNSETDTQQIDVEQTASEEEILTPGFEGSNKIQGFGIFSFFQAAWHKLMDISEHIAATPMGIERNRPRKSNLNDSRIIKEKLDQFPRGFPKLAYLQSSNGSFSVLRKFQYLSTRILLQKEVEINELEKLLMEQDIADEKSDLEERQSRLRTAKYFKKTPTKDPGGVDNMTQPELTQVICENLKEYMEFANLVRQLNYLAEAPTRDYESVLNWILANKPLKPGWYDFIWHMGDFASLKTPPAQSGGSGKPGFFENIVMALAPHSPFSKFIQPDTDRSSVNNYSDFRFNLVKQTLIIVTASGSILVPVFMLFFLTLDRVAAASIVLVAVVLFSTMLSGVADTTEDKLFIAIISYSAVLCTFLATMNQAVVLGSET